VDLAVLVAQDRQHRPGQIAPAADLAGVRSEIPLRAAGAQRRALRRQRVAVGSTDRAAGPEGLASGAQGALGALVLVALAARWLYS
jgi:hypothetical protein